MLRIDRFLRPNISLAVAIAFLTQMAHFGDLTFAFQSGQPMNLPLASVSPSHRSKGPAEPLGLVLASSERWQSLSEEDRDQERRPQRNDRPGDEGLFKEESQRWKPAGDESLDDGRIPFMRERPIRDDLPRRRYQEWKPIKDDDFEKKIVISPKTQIAEKIIGRNGGTITAQKGNISVSIPPGALRGNKRITVAPNKSDVTIDLKPGTPRDAFLLDAAYDLGPPGTRFLKPVQVTIGLSQTAIGRIQNGDELAVVNIAGNTVEYISNYRLDSQGKVHFLLNHFSKTLLLLFVFGAIAVAYSSYGSQKVICTTNPQLFITPNGDNIKKFVEEKNNLNLPTEISDNGFTDLGINKKFSGELKEDFMSGNKVAGLPDGSGVNCQDLTYFVTSLLEAKKNPRFENYKGVWGSIKPKDKNYPHMWVEMEIDGKIYVVDTFNVYPIGLYPKEMAYKRFNLKPVKEFGYKKPMKKYAEWVTKPVSPLDSQAADFAGRVKFSKLTLKYEEGMASANFPDIEGSIKVSKGVLTMSLNAKTEKPGGKGKLPHEITIDARVSGELSDRLKFQGTSSGSCDIGYKKWTGTVRHRYTAKEEGVASLRITKESGNRYAVTGDFDVILDHLHATSSGGTRTSEQTVSGCYITGKFEGKMRE